MVNTSSTAITVHRLFERLLLLVLLLQSVHCYWYNPFPSPDSHTPVNQSDNSNSYTSVNQSATSSSYTSVNQSANSSSQTSVNQSANSNSQTVNQSVNSSSQTYVNQSANASSHISVNQSANSGSHTSVNQSENTSKDNRPENHFFLHLPQRDDNNTKPQDKTAMDIVNTTESYDNIIHINNSASVSSHPNDFKSKDLIKNICGVDEFCSNMEISPGFNTELKCCPVCNCHPSCVIAKNCCPGQELHMSDLKPEDPVCMPLYNILNDIISKTHKKNNLNQEKATSPDQTTNTETNLNHKPIHDNRSPTDPMYAEYLVISSCPSDYHDHELSANCSKPESEYIRDYLPVVDIFSSKLYLNHFCAMCHNITSYLTIEIVTNCTQLYLMDPLPEYLEDVNKVMNNCLAYIDPSSNEMLKTELCYTERQDNRIISKCNTTGHWELYDVYTETLCLEGGHIVPYERKDGNVTITYNNIYCYLCNSRTDNEETCSADDLDNYEHQSDNPFADFNSHINMPLKADNVQYILTPNAHDYETFNYTNGKQCMKGFLPDVYTNRCRRFICPLHKTPFYNICQKSTREVTGLTVVGKLHIELRDSVINVGHINQTREIVSSVQESITNYLEVHTLGCASVPGEIYATTESEYTNSFHMVYKIQNTHNCSVQTVIGIFTKIARTNIEVPPQQMPSNTAPGFSMKMIYKKLSTSNFTMKIKPQVEEPVKHEVLLNASFDCPRIVINLSEYYNFVKQGILKRVDKNILHQEFTTDTHMIEICFREYLEYWLMQNNKASQLDSTTPKTFDVSFTAIVTIGSMLCIIVVIVTYCIFPELRFIPGKLVMVLSFNLLLAQTFYAFGAGLEVDNGWCKMFGASIHFFWLSTIFSMNAILILMMRSLCKPLHAENRAILDSRSTSEFIKYVIHCYLLPLVFVIINLLSSTLKITEQFGYGGQLCYIREVKMRLYTFLIPLGTVMVVNFILFILIVFLLRFYMKTRNENVLVKQIFIIMKLITMSGIYWIFGFLYGFTLMAVFKYLFVILIAGQGFFLMWSFIFNWRVYELYKTAISKYIRKLWEDRSKSYSLSTPVIINKETC